MQTFVKRVNLIGYYTADQALLEGSAEALRRLADYGRRATALATLGLRTPVNALSHPYDDYLRAIQIRPADGLVLLEVKERVLEVTGGSAELSAVAENLLWFANQPYAAGEHLHIEHYPGHSLLAQQSLPLVVARLPE